MLRELTKQLHSDYFKVYRISQFISNGLFLIAIIAYAIVAQLKDWTMVPVWIAVAVLVLSVAVFGWIAPAIKKKVFRYELFEEELEIKSGIIFISNVLVPMVKVQHVELESGPLMRKYSLASVEVVTAATTHKISGLKLQEAEALKRRIGILARVEEQEE